MDFNCFGVEIYAFVNKNARLKQMRVESWKVEKWKDERSRQRILRWGPSSF